MGLKQRFTREKLDHYASDGPHVARIRPTEAKNDFRGAVVSRRYYGAVMPFDKRRAPKINQANRMIDWDAIRGVFEVRTRHQENILGLQVRVHESERVQVSHRYERLLAKALHRLRMKWLVSIRSQKVIQTRSALIKHHAHVSLIIERPPERDAIEPFAIPPRRVALGERLQDFDFHHRRVAILLYVSNHLDRAPSLGYRVPAFQNPTESPLAEQRDDLVLVRQRVPERVSQVPIGVVRSSRPRPRRLLFHLHVSLDVKPSQLGAFRARIDRRHRGRRISVRRPRHRVARHRRPPPTSPYLRRLPSLKQHLHRAPLPALARRRRPRRRLRRSSRAHPSRRRRPRSLPFPSLRRRRLFLASRVVPRLHRLPLLSHRVRRLRPPPRARALPEISPHRHLAPRRPRRRASRRRRRSRRASAVSNRSRVVSNRASRARAPRHPAHRAAGVRRRVSAVERARSSRPRVVARVVVRG